MLGQADGQQSGRMRSDWHRGLARGDEFQTRYIRPFIRKAITMPSSRNRKARSLFTQSTQLAFAAPLVVAHRVARMAIAESPMSARDRKEFSRMAAEKTAAFNESWNAMALEAMRANQAMALSFLRSFSPLCTHSTKRKRSASALAAQWQSAVLGVAGKGVTPVRRKAVANAKRLARTRLR